MKPPTMKHWEFQDICQYFNDNGTKSLFNYVAQLSFQEEEYMWWNDSLGITFDADSAITFMTDFIEENPESGLGIMCNDGKLGIMYNFGRNFYTIEEHIQNDAHCYVFQMMLWVIAKGFGFEEGEQNG